MQECHRKVQVGLLFVNDFWPSEVCALEPVHQWLLSAARASWVASQQRVEGAQVANAVRQVSTPQRDGACSQGARGVGRGAAVPGGWPMGEGGRAAAQRDKMAMPSHQTQ